ncbi:MAG: tetratricopeptide repeat protein [Hyphomicrobium sp.]
MAQSILKFVRFGSVCGAVAVLSASTVLAQVGLDPQTGAEAPPPSAEQESTPPPAQRHGQRANKGPPGMMGLPFPKSHDDVPKTLQSLYAFLATEGDKRQGGEIGAAIEKLWRYAGSDTVNLLLDRAEGFSAKNESARGLPFADAAVDLAPDYAEAWSHRAYLHYRMENYNAALGDLRRALALDPNHFRALDAMAKILVLVGEKKAALAAYEKLLLVHPNIEGGKEALEELKKEVEGQGI